MKYIFILHLLLATPFLLQAQRIYKIEMTSTGTNEKFCIAVDDNVVINIANDGKIINYGIEYMSDRFSNYTRLENYNGRVEFFPPSADKAFAGKEKYIGRTPISYYASYEDETLRGKVKTIGTSVFTYYMPFDDASMKGKLKAIGSANIQYFSAFENAGLKGKLKMVGYVNLSYYSSFDDKAFQGKIKNIGQTVYTYYPSYQSQYAGGMKTGNYQVNEGGIQFLLR